MAFQLNGQPISIDNEIVINGVRYPNLRNLELRKQLGVVEVPDPEYYDHRFYWAPNNPKQLEDKTETNGDGETFTSTGLKTQWINQTKQIAGSMLAHTDWRVTRAAEGIQPVDADTLAERAAIRAYSDEQEAKIQACDTVEELIDVVTKQQWPAVNSQGR